MNSQITRMEAFDRLHAMARELSDQAVQYTTWLHRYSFFSTVWAERLVEIVAAAKDATGGHIHVCTIETLRDTLLNIVLVTDMSRLWTGEELTEHLFKALTEHSAEHDPHDGYLGQW